MPSRRESLSLAQARRIALAAQALAGPVPTQSQTGRRQLLTLVRRLGAVQIDSVNVLVRAQYLPAFSRLGCYDRTELDTLAYRRRAVFEYWGHEASLLPIELHPFLRWRMQRARSQFETWGRLAELARTRPDYVEQVLAEVRERGPVTAGELADEERRQGTWWTWTDAKTALEYLFWAGEVTTVMRRGFERVYDVSERVLPATVLAAPTPNQASAHQELLARAARALGVATASDLADYYRIRPLEARTAIAELVEAGRLRPVSVEGWRQAAYLDPAAVLPRRATAAALLAPFDPLVWERARVERLFGFRYRIEIYVPAPQRVHGYYVLPYLQDDRLVARVDLKSDRAGGRLLVRGAHAEPDTPPETAARLAGELVRMANWLTLSDVDASEARGDLAVPLRSALGG